MDDYEQNNSESKSYSTDRDFENLVEKVSDLLDKVSYLEDQVGVLNAAPLNSSLDPQPSSSPYDYNIYGPDVMPDLIVHVDGDTKNNYKRFTSHKYKSLNRIDSNNIIQLYEFSTADTKKVICKFQDCIVYQPAGGAPVVCDSSVGDCGTWAAGFAFADHRHQVKVKPITRVKYADSAGHARRADSAGHADSADRAKHSDSSNHATYAGWAYGCDTCRYAARAGYADCAGRAPLQPHKHSRHSDFESDDHNIVGHPEWTYILAGGGSLRNAMTGSIGDNMGATSIDPNYRKLYSSSSTTATVDWQFKELRGGWTTSIDSFKCGGNLVGNEVFSDNDVTAQGDLQAGLDIRSVGGDYYCRGSKGATATNPNTSTYVIRGGLFVGNITIKYNGDVQPDELVMVVS